MGITHGVAGWARRRPRVAAVVTGLIVLVGIAGVTADRDTGQDVTSPPTTAAGIGAATDPPVAIAAESTQPLPAERSDAGAANTAGSAMAEPPAPTAAPAPAPTPPPSQAVTTPPTSAPAVAIQPLLAAAPAAREFSTRDLAAATCTVSETLQSGSSGSAVRCLQRRLVEAQTSGPGIGVDGDFGPQTDTAVREFQSAAGLTVDGIAGRQTLTALEIWTAPRASPSSGGSGSSSGSSSSGSCDPSYPTVCIPPYPPDLDCGEISHRRFTVLPPDPHGFDGNDDGVGCEWN